MILKYTYGPFFCSQIFYENWATVSLFKRTTVLMSDCFLLSLDKNTVMFVSPHESRIVTSTDLIERSRANCD